MKHRLASIVLLAVAIPACHESPTSAGEALPLRPVYSDSILVYLPVGRTEVITSAQRFAQVWNEIHPADLGSIPLPAVDFTRESLLFAARGQFSNGCHEIKIAGAMKSGTLIDVEVQSVDWTGCPCPATLVYPLQFVAIAVPNARASFQEKNVIKQCSP